MFESSTASETLAERIGRIALLALAVLTPLLVLPVFTNFMITTKILVVMVVAILLLSLFVWQILHRQTIELPRSPLLLPLGLFLVSALVSSFATTNYPVENFLGMGGIYISVALIAIIGSSLLKRSVSDSFIKVMTVTGSVLAVTTVLQTLGVGPTRVLNILFGIDLPHTSLFNLSGAPLISAQLLGVLLAGHVLGFLVNRKLSSFQMINLPFLVVGFALSLWSVLPGKEAAPVLLPFGVSWSIITDIMKSPRSAIIGVGPENFSSAYMVFRPAWTNTTTWWTNSFGQGANVPLTLLATSGLLGFFSWVWLAGRSLLASRAVVKREPILTGMIVAMLLLQLVLPSNIVMLTVFALALAYFLNVIGRGTNKIHILKPAMIEANLSAKNQQNFWFLMPIIVAGLIGGFLLYGVGRAYAASNAFFRSSNALAQNDAVLGYDLQRRAVELNPYLSLYRSNYALTNFAIATALSNKADITEQEKQQVAQLIQQGIREARAATLLRPDDSSTWRILGQIYRNLIGTAEGADQWALSAYVEAINSHPADPTLRVELGGLFLSAQNFADAVSLFQQAAQLKPDYPNAYYNLAVALKAANQLEGARTAYQQTLQLLPADSEDYIQANRELEEIEAAIAASGSAQTNSNTSASPTPTPSPEIPSLLNQNLNEGETDVVNEPATDALAAPTPTPLPPVTPVTTPSPTPAP